MAQSAFDLSALSLADRLRILRVSKHWRQRDLAEAADVTQSEVSALERGMYVPLSVKRRIFRELGLEAQDA